MYIALACTSTEVSNSDHADSGSITGSTGDVVVVTCNAGYSGGGNAICGSNSEFNTLECSGAVDR